MPFFQNLKRTDDVSFFFLPELYVPGLMHFLQQERVTGWQIIPKHEIIPRLPEGFEIPEVRLTETAPRVEARVSCFVSYYDIDTVNDAYWSLIYSKAWVQRHIDQAKRAADDCEFESAMAQDPGPFSITRPAKKEG